MMKINLKTKIIIICFLFQNFNFALELEQRVIQKFNEGKSIITDAIPNAIKDLSLIIAEYANKSIIEEFCKELMNKLEEYNKQIEIFKKQDLLKICPEIAKTSKEFNKLKEEANEVLLKFMKQEEANNSENNYKEIIDNTHKKLMLVFMNMGLLEIKANCLYDMQLDG